MRSTFLLAALFFCFLPLSSSSDKPSPDPVLPEVEDEDDDEEADEPEDTGEESGSFLDPYYSSEDDEDGCSLPGCGDVWDIFGFLGSVRVSYEPDPTISGESRVNLGPGGNPAALDLCLGFIALDGGQGIRTGVMFRTPSPWVLEVLHQYNRLGDEPDLSLLYTGASVQLVYGSPVQLMAGAHMIFPQEKGRELLTGSGITLNGRWAVLNFLAFDMDYRLSWVRTLPLHRGELSMVLLDPPLETGAGFMFLRNSSGEVLWGPFAGMGLSF